MRSRPRRRLVGCIPALVLVGGWQLLVMYGGLPPSQSAAPSAIARQIVRLVGDGSLVDHLAASAFRLLLGIPAGVLAGTLMGLLTGTRRVLDEILSPTIAFMAGIPVVVWLPFWVMMFGSGEIFKIGMTALAGFFVSYTGVYAAVRATRGYFVEVAEVYSLTYGQQLRFVFVPSAAAAVFEASRAVLGLSWVILFFVEYASAREGWGGLGWFIANARAVGRVEDEFSGLVVLGLVAFAADFAVRRLRAYVLRWSDAFAQ